MNAKLEPPKIWLALGVAEPTKTCHVGIVIPTLSGLGHFKFYGEWDSTANQVLKVHRWDVREDMMRIKPTAALQSAAWLRDYSHSAATIRSVTDIGLTPWLEDFAQKTSVRVETSNYAVEYQRWFKHYARTWRPHVDSLVSASTPIESSEQAPVWGF